MRALEVFGFKYYLTGPSDHPVNAPDGIDAVVRNFTQHFHLGSGTGCMVQTCTYMFMNLRTTHMSMYVHVHIAATPAISCCSVTGAPKEARPLVLAVLVTCCEEWLGLSYQAGTCQYNWLKPV